MSVSVHLKGNLGMQFLLHANFKIVLRIGANVAHTLAGVAALFPIKLASREYSIGGGENKRLYEARSTDFVRVM